MAGCKFCPKCKTMKLRTEYAKLYDGVQHWCRDCARDYQRQRKLENENVEEPKSHLYVMSYVGVPPGIYKVGQSTNVGQRVQALENSNLLRVNVNALFPEWGYLESSVHDSLAVHRIAGYRSREWYSCSLETVLSAIAAARRQQPPSVDGQPRPLARTLDSYFGSSAASTASDDTQNGVTPSPLSATRWEFQ